MSFSLLKPVRIHDRAYVARRLVSARPVGIASLLFHFHSNSAHLKTALPQCAMFFLPPLQNLLRQRVIKTNHQRPRLYWHYVTPSRGLPPLCLDRDWLIRDWLIEWSKNSILSRFHGNRAMPLLMMSKLKKVFYVLILAFGVFITHRLFFLVIVTVTVNLNLK